MVRIDLGRRFHREIEPPFWITRKNIRFDRPAISPKQERSKAKTVISVCIEVENK